MATMSKLNILILWRDGHRLLEHQLSANSLSYSPGKTL
jgi:hypothetical protein